MQEDDFGRYFCLLNGPAVPQFITKGERKTDISLTIEFWKMFMKLKKTLTLMYTYSFQMPQVHYFLKNTILEWLFINLIFPNIKINAPFILAPPYTVFLLLSAYV